MFGIKRQAACWEAASEVKAMRGRHARVDAGSIVVSGASGGDVLINGSGAYADFDAMPRRGAACGAPSAYPACEAAAPEPSASSSDAVSSAELERKFQDFFRMGAVVAIGELYDEGLLGDKRMAAPAVRDYLISFGVGSLEEVRALGVTGPYLEDFANVFGPAESFPPAA